MAENHIRLILGIIAYLTWVGPNYTIAEQELDPANDPGWGDVPELVNRILDNAPRIPDRQMVLEAVADGKSNALPSLQAAIDTIHKAGGGRVVVPSGHFFLEGPVVLKSGVELQLSEGALLEFSGDPDKYLPPVLTRWEGTLLFNHSPLIYAFQATDIALTGKGTIDGNGEVAFSSWRDRQKPDQLALREMGGSNFVPLHNRVFGGGHVLRPSMVQFFGCERVKVEGPTFHDSPFWIVHLVFSHYVIVRDILVESFRLNNDGIDPDSSSHVLIEDSTFRTGDDAVAIKSGRDNEGRTLGVRSENIVIRNCNFEQVHNGVAIGSEMSGGVRNVFVENCRVGEGRNLIYFKSNLDRGGVVENVHVRNIEVDTASVSLVRFQTNYHSWRGEFFPPTFRNFVVENVHCRKATDIGIWAEGHPDSPLDNVLLRNITINDAHRPVRVRTGDDVTFDNVRINGEIVTPDDSEPVELTE